MSNSSCLICKSIGSLTLVYKTSPTEAAEYFLTSSSEQEKLALRNHIQTLWESDECEIFKCSDCKSRFARPHKAGDAKFYNMIAPKPAYPKSRWEFSLTSSRTVDLLRQDGKLLEIGAGSGSFIQQVLELGVDPKSVVATEFSTHAISALDGLGVRAESVDFREGVPGGPFRVIVLFQTLEHLDRLDNVIQSLDCIATHDANLFFSVPNVEYLEWAELNLGGVDMPPNHITGFSLEGLIKLFSHNGWDLHDFDMHARKSLVARCKFGAMRGLQYPRNRIQRALKKHLKLDSSDYSQIKLYLCAGIALLSDWKLLKTVPAEDILIQLRRKSH
jgi:2-polyprenyl-3-methyl-5-hydroxy-6-metoxy-1,4-benzoquinol methylase